jgi:hypothetical protein
MRYPSGNLGWLLRTSHRGIGVSGAVVERTVIGSLRVSDALTQSRVELKPGVVVSNYRIQRHSQSEVDAGAEPYIVLFDCDGREYQCPLPTFQARTSSPDAANPAGAIAV